jgi:26S proteasome regulatory subunit N9
MRALSVHLIEGTMDQVDQTVHVTWVMPRVLNAAQLRELAARCG